MPTNYKVEWSYINSQGKRRTEYDTFFEWSAKDAVKTVRKEYEHLSDLRIERVLKECSDCWEEVGPIVWEE